MFHFSLKIEQMFCKKYFTMSPNSFPTKARLWIVAPWMMKKKIKHLKHTRSAPVRSMLTNNNNTNTLTTQKKLSLCPLSSALRIYHTNGTITCLKSVKNSDSVLQLVNYPWAIRHTFTRANVTFWLASWQIVHIMTNYHC